MKNYTTRELVEELKTREGVVEINVQYEEDVFLYGLVNSSPLVQQQGPARIFIVTD